MTLDELQQELNTRDKGVLLSGAHQADSGEFCVLEFGNAVRGVLNHSDTPGQFPDLRPLNDARWSSDAVRTAALLPVLVAYWDWSTWTEKQRQQVMERVVIGTVNRIIAELPGLSEEIRGRCRQASTLTAAEAAAAEAAAAAAAWAADIVLQLACTIWIDAAQEQ